MVNYCLFVNILLMFDVFVCTQNKYILQRPESEADGDGDTDDENGIDE